MIRHALLVVSLVLTCRAEAQASTITFSGEYDGGDSSLSFSGSASNSTGRGMVTVSYFNGANFYAPPVYGTETITGPATFQQFPPPYGQSSEVFSVGISDGSSFGLDFYTDRTIVSFSDPSVPVSMTDLASVSFTITNVPLPSTAPLLGSALIGLGAIGYRLKRKTVDVRALRGGAGPKVKVG